MNIYEGKSSVVCRGKFENLITNSTKCEIQTVVRVHISGVTIKLFTGIVDAASFHSKSFLGLNRKWSDIKEGVSVGATSGGQRT